MIVRSRGFMSGSPPPARAATVSSLMMRVKILPRLASSGALLVLDRVPTWNGRTCRNSREIARSDKSHEIGADKSLHSFSRQDDPDVRALVPGPAAVVAEHGVDARTRRARAGGSSAGSTACGTSARSDARRVGRPRRSTYRCSKVVSRRARILPDRLDEREVRAAGRAARAAGRGCGTRASSARRAPGRGRTVPPRLEHARDRRRASPSRSRSREQRLQDAVGRDHHVERAARETAATRMSPRTSADAAPTSRRAARAAARRARASIGADRSMPTSATPARASGSEMRPVPQPSSSTGPSRARRDRAARTARRAGRASARSPSRRTARTRPSLPSPLRARGSTVGCPSGMSGPTIACSLVRHGELAGDDRAACAAGGRGARGCRRTRGCRRRPTSLSASPDARLRQHLPHQPQRRLRPADRPDRSVEIAPLVPLALGRRLHARQLPERAEQPDRAGERESTRTR